MLSGTSLAIFKGVVFGVASLFSCELRNSICQSSSTYIHTDFFLFCLTIIFSQPWQCSKASALPCKWQIIFHLTIAFPMLLASCYTIAVSMRKWSEKLHSISSGYYSIDLPCYAHWGEAASLYSIGKEEVQFRQILPKSRCFMEQTLKWIVFPTTAICNSRISCYISYISS